MLTQLHIILRQLGPARSWVAENLILVDGLRTWKMPKVRIGSKLIAGATALNYLRNGERMASRLPSSRP
jgi:hypothetical protein